MSKPSFIRQFLDCSTGHLTPATRDALEVRSLEAIVASPTEYGWFVWVPTEGYEIGDGPAQVPADMDAAFKLAKEYGADYVLFDADAPQIETLPFYDN